MRPSTAILLAALAAAPVHAQQGAGGHDSHHPAAGLADGEVRKVDKEAKKITLRHGPLPALDMPAMTMVFQVRDPALLDKVKPGDKVRFQAEEVSGAYFVTRIEPAKPAP